MQHDELDNDDLPVGRILSRREVLALFGAAGAALLVGCSTGGSSSGSATRTTAQSTTSSAAVTPTNTMPAAASATASQAATQAATQATTGTTSTTTSGATATSGSTATGAATAAASTTAVASLPTCVVSPALTEGPYFVDEHLNRADIRSDPTTGEVKDGAALQLTLVVSQVTNDGCTPLADAMVDIWHCDAQGVYSDASDPSFNTKGQKFLRGYQVTDANGMAQFGTIYPGWYQGRAVHIHFKVRSEAGTAQSYEFTSQFFFDENLSGQVFALAPYASKGSGWMHNNQDGIYQQSGGATVLDVTPSGDGYAAKFSIGMQLG